ncbi:hypothetical protein ACVSK3_19165 [Pseudomonas aeruginosa]
MKLVLNFDGSALTANNLQQAITAAGANTTINIDTAQAVNITTLLQVIGIAGNTKRLNATFNGAQLTSSNLQQAVNASGSNTNIAVNTAQAVNINTLLSIISSVGTTKHFSADFNGAQLTANNLQQAVTAAQSGTSISVNTAQAANITALPEAINAAGSSKAFSANFNGAQLTGTNLQQVLTAAGTNTSIGVNTAQAINITTFLQLLSIAGNTKKFSADFNGAQLTSNNLQQAVSAAGTNSSISVNTAQAANITPLLQAIQNAGNNKNFSADFNGAQLTADNLQQALTAAGTKTKISVNTAQAVSINSMLQLLSIAGISKLFSAAFNGAQLTANNLQQAVSNAGANTTIIVTSAQSAPIATLLDAIGTAG